MDATVHHLSEIPEEPVIPLLTRQKVVGEHVLLAHVRLSAGCHVEPHRHDSEQIAYMLEGQVKWTLGDPGTPEHRVVLAQAGDIIQLPAGFLHGVDAIEDSLIVDVLSPPGPMGIDRQGAQ